MVPADFVNHMLPAAVLVGLRIAALMSLAPFFGGEGLPRVPKMVFTVMVTAVMLPVHPPPVIPITLGGWLQAAVGEMLLGLMMALAMHFVFESARLAGSVMGLQLGYSLVNIIDPQSQVDTPVLSVFSYTLAILIFLQLNVHHWILRGLAHSYDVVAPGQAAFTLTTTTALLHAAGGMWASAVEIAAPVLVATVMVDFLLGFMAKASPQLPVLAVSLAMKACVGFSVLWMVLGHWPMLFDRYFESAMHLSERLLISTR
jgi:flagellar biosynthetic protein FliR